MKTSFDFSREKLFRAPARKTLNSSARFAHLVRFYINNKMAPSYHIICLGFAIFGYNNLYLMPPHHTPHSSTHAIRHAKNCKKQNRAFDGWLQWVFWGKWWRRREKDCVKICLRFNETACHSFSSPWSDLILLFLSIYFYIHEMMGKSWWFQRILRPRSDWFICEALK